MKTLGNLTTTSIGFAGLEKSLTAVKVSPNRDLAYREHSSLQAIKLSTTPEADAMRRYFLSVKSVDDFSISNHTHSFLSLPAIMPPITLEDLLGCNDIQIPIALVYHFFLSLAPALISLRDGVEWTHNDTKSDNIMIHFPEGSPYDVPHFVFVDLGMWYSLKDATNQSGDCKNLLGLVRLLAERAGASGELEWMGFRRMLDGVTAEGRSRSDVDAEFGGIWDRWRDIADRARRKRTVGEVDAIEKLFEIVALEQGEVTDEDVLNATVGHV